MTLPTPPRVLQAPPGKAEEASHDGSQRPAVKTDNGTAMYGIRFMVPNGKIPGYLVKVGRRNVNHTKWFGIAQYGDASRALAAARAWQLAVEARREMERLISGYYVPNVPDEFVARAVARG